MIFLSFPLIVRPVEQRGQKELLCGSGSGSVEPAQRWRSSSIARAAADSSLSSLSVDSGSNFIEVILTAGSRGAGDLQAAAVVN